MYQDALLLCLIALSNFVFSSLNVSIALLGGEYGLNYRIYVGVAYIMSLIGVILIYKYGNYSQTKRDLIVFTTILIIGTYVLAVSGFLSDEIYYGLMGVSLCLIGLSSIGVHLYALVVLLLKNMNQAIFYFPFAELFWDIGTSLGPSLLLLLDDPDYFGFVYIIIGCIIIAIFVMFYKAHEEMEFEWSPKDLPYTELRYDIIPLVYVLVSTTSLDPVIQGVVQELSRDDDKVIIYLITSTSASFLITIFLSFFLEKVRVKLLLLIGILFSTIGMILVGPIAFADGGNLSVFSIGILFLETGVSVGTGSGLASLYQTVQSTQEIDAYAIWIISAIYLFSLAFARLSGPWLMLWLISSMDYEIAASVFAGIGVVISILYYFHFRDHLRKDLGELKRLL